ncbi:MAG TPA: glycosyltransferase family 4 protein [Gemmataceae bacterium]|nr:glycosyltransferase family 4 protein [Gemmataceae bacterium]
MRVVHLSTIHQALDVRIFHKECRTVAAGGYRVHYLVADPPAPELAGVVFHAFRRPSRAFRYWRICNRLLNVYRQAAALRAHVYHFHDPELIPVGILLKLTGARVIYDVHEDSPQEAISLNRDRPLAGRLKSLVWRVFEAAAMPALDAFICATPRIARKFPRAKTITVHNFPRLDEFPPLPPCHPCSRSASRPNHVVYVGGITAIRGALEMVQAMSLLPAQLQAKLVLVGDFLPPELKAEAERLPGWDRVEALSWQPRDAVVQQLLDAKVALVLIHPERDHLDALPNKLFEYMAAGLPVVASDFPLWRRIIEGAGCGLVVDPLDTRAIAGAVRYLLEHPEEAEAMGKRGRQAVLAEYNWETEARKLLGLYRELEAS